MNHQFILKVFEERIRSARKDLQDYTTAKKFGINTVDSDCLKKYYSIAFNIAQTTQTFLVERFDGACDEVRELLSKPHQFLVHKHSVDQSANKLIVFLIVLEAMLAEVYEQNKLEYFKTEDQE